MSNNDWTIQKRFGFQDNDLKTPNHDEIMQWTTDNIQYIVDNLYPLHEWHLSTGYHSHIYRDELLEKYAKNAPTYLPNLGVKAGECTWEYVIQNKKYTVGFIDIVVDVLQPCFILNDKFEWILGFEHHAALAIEIKSHVESIGQLIRQIRLYQQYYRADWLVVAPNKKIKSTLESQGISFIQYTG